MSDPLKELPPRKRKYVKARAKGKNKMQAALEAGYSESVAAKAKSHIETPDVQRAFAELVRQAIPEAKIIQRLSEGLDAEITTVSVLGGVQNMRTEKTTSPDMRERREYLKLAAQFGGRVSDKPVEGSGGPLRIIVDVVRPARARD